MKQISEIAIKLYQNQLLTACNVVIDGKAKISSIVIDTNTFEVIKGAIPYGLIVKPYEIDEKYSLVVLSKKYMHIDLMEEINDLSISKDLRKGIYEDLLGRV